MNENEQLARWLGKMHFDGVWWDISGEHAGIYAVNEGWEDDIHTIEQIRTSNEWAGALLEKLGAEIDRGLELHTSMNSAREVIWFCDVLPDKYGIGVRTWRDAVVDAALEVIKRETKEAPP